MTIAVGHQPADCTLPFVHDKIVHDKHCAFLGWIHDNNRTLTKTLAKELSVSHLLYITDFVGRNGT